MELSAAKPAMNAPSHARRAAPSPPHLRASSDVQARWSRATTELSLETVQETLRLIGIETLVEGISADILNETSVLF
jgi:hypothetical protein